MDKYRNGNDWKKLCEFGIDTTQRLPSGYTMDRTLFDCGEYSWDGIFNIVTLPENMSIYHGGGSAANNLAFIPLGRDFIGNLARNGPAGAIADAVPVIERKEAIYPVLSQYGGPNPAWFSNPYTANEYAKRNDDAVIGANCSKIFNIGQFAIQVRDCILAFKLMRDMKLILIDDPYNIMVIRGLFASMSQQEIQDIQPMLRSATKPGAMEIKGSDDLVKALSLFCFGSEWDRTKKYEDRFKPNIDLMKVELKEDEDHAMEHCNRFYLQYQEVHNGSVVWYRIPHFTRRSSYDWDLAIGTALCFLLRTRYPAARYDGYGAPYVRSDQHTSWRSQGGHSYFSLEMTICNAADILTRDYDNPIDWQSPHAPGAVTCPTEAREYIDFLGKHVVANYKEYAGNMYENMVWTMLVTEHMLTTPGARFAQWQSTIARHGNLKEAAYIASILAFFYNFRETFSCLARFVPSTCEVSYYSCNVDDSRLTYTGILASRSLVNALNITGGGAASADTDQVYLLVSAFLDAQPHIFQFLNQPDNSAVCDTADEVLSMIIKNSYQFGKVAQAELVDLMLLLGLTVIFASILIRGSPVGIIPILTEPIPGPHTRCNLRSVRFPWIENRSRPYPGAMRSEADINTVIQNLTDRFIVLARTIKERQDAQVPAIMQRIARQVQDNLVFPDAIQHEIQVMYNTLFPGRKDRMADAMDVLKQLYAVLKTHEADVEEHVRLQWEQDHNRRPAIDIMRQLRINVQEQLNHVIDLPVTTQEELKKANDSYYAMWVGYLGIAYIPAMEGCNSRLTLQIDHVPPPDTWLPTGMRKFERVWYILKTLKPILGAIFETYSMTQYPALKTYPARYNHNSLNHLRSVWYTAVFLANSGFTNDLNNMDIFLLLLGSVFKSIGRTDESNAGPSARDYNMGDVLLPFQGHGSLPKQRMPELPPECGYDFSTWTMPGTVVISMTIAYQVLCSISRQFPLQQSKYSETIVFTSGIIANDEMLARYDTCQEMKDVVDSVSIMCMGHYLDHCRPTTRFSQLDTITSPVVDNNPFSGDTVGITDFNKPLGQPWLKFLLERYDFQNDGWHSFKQFWFDKQIDVLTRTGFKRIKNGPFLQADGKDHTSIGSAPSIEVDWGQRCNTLFDPKPTVRIVTLANSFDRAWDSIFTPQSLLS